MKPQFYDQDRDVPELICITKVEAKGLLKLLRYNDFTDPMYRKFAADMGEILMDQGIR